MAQARYCARVASGLYAGPGNTLGLGNPMPPQVDMEETVGIGDTSKDFAEQIPGSGDTL